MKNSRNILLIAFGFLVVSLAAGRRAQATLGESSDSIASDQKALSAVQRATTARKDYTVQEIQSDSTFIREYISPTGVVFGIAWNGLTRPDLTSLLGSYAAEYKEALRQTPRKPGHRRSSVVHTNRIIVEQWGHIRNMQGRAYAPALIPPGLSVDEIK
ncbi:MAG TPA: DUF2844 domain-containing protein [Nitrospiria bacterium]|nr:DUF2844 domain-containing protein [Nitrospiria bacterium]